jgi:hypothetical protein
MFPMQSSTARMKMKRIPLPQRKQIPTGDLNAIMQRIDKLDNLNLLVPQDSCLYAYRQTK